MLQNQLPPKNSPSRRRTKRPINSPARKTYASENDMPTEPHYPIDFTGPMTPRKSASNTPVPSSQPQHAKSRPRNGNNTNANSNVNGNGNTANGNGNRPRAKQQVSSTTSPGPTKQGRHTPPQSAPPKTANQSAAAAAFAGATFHASPAPSSLPIPSFMKGLDSPGLKDTGRGSREPSPPATDSEAAPTPKNRFVKPDISRQESPLDIFFRAQRAENERVRRASLSNIAVAPNPAPFSPPVLPHSPSEPKTVPNGFGTARNRRPGFERSSSGISSNELDGNPGAPILPAFSTPWSERLRAARSTSKPAEPALQSPKASQPQPRAQSQQASTDASEKLKQFLAISSPPSNGQNYQTAVPPQGPPAPMRRDEWNFPARPQQPPLATAAVSRPDYNRPAEILNMENTLRQVLKIDGLSLGPSRQPHYQSS